MKIRAEKQILESILTTLQPFLEKKDASQITSHIHFQTTADGKCTIKASDMEMGLQIVTEHFEIVGEGSFTANGKKLLNIVRILREGTIDLETENDHLTISQKRSKFKLPTFDPSTYPQFPGIEDKPAISLDSLSLIKNLKKITSAIDSNNPKYELNGALINIRSDKTDLVGTDTRRLAIATIENSSEDELDIIVPKKAIIEIQKLFLDRISIHYDSTNLVITNENHFFFTRLINGRFPDYERIIPRSSRYTIELPKKEMLDSLKMITTISQEIKITFLEKSIIFDSLSSDVEAKTELSIETGMEQPFELSLNSRYLLDFLSQVDSENFSISLNESNLPFLVRDGNFITIIMPIVS